VNRSAASRSWFIWLAGLLTLGSGILDLLLVVTHPHAHVRGEAVLEFFPFEFHHLSRFLAVLVGFGLAITSLALLRRKRRAWWTATLLAALAIPLHLVHRSDWRGTAAACVLLAVLLATRPMFRVRSEPPNLRAALLTLGQAGVLAFGYGVAGFWFLEGHHFGRSFDIYAAMRQTLLYLTFIGDPNLHPHSHYAHWFLNSLTMTTIAGVLFALFSLYRPVVHRLRIHPRAREQAAALVARHGRTSLDFFKTWPDKSFFFAPDRNAFLAYRVGGRHAIVLGDPVGPDEAIEPLVGEFRTFCAENDWSCAFHQAMPDHLPIYQRLGWHRLKIGDDAIVDVQAFGLEGRERREFRNTISRLERQGVSWSRHEPPLAESLVDELEEVSDEWLQLPGRRERQFTLGVFTRAYVRATPVVVVRDAHGRVIAFANLIPSFAPGEATTDLMRRRIEIPNGAMDYLYVKLLFQLKAAGLKRFNLGMAPMAGFHEKEHASPEEHALHTFFQRLNFLFRFRGLRAYKAKFASSWEPRYLMHQGILELPAIAIALAQVSSLRGGPESKAAFTGSRTRRALRVAAGWVVAFFCLGWILHDIRLSDLWQSMQGIRWFWVVPAIAADVFSYWCQGVRWSLLLRPLGAVPPLRATQAVYSGLLTNEIFPMRVGELVRAYLVSRWTGQAMYRVFPSMAVERLFDGFWLCIGFGLAALAVPLPRELARAADGVGAAVLAGAALLATLALRAPRRGGGVVGRLAGELRGVARSAGFVRAALASAGVLLFQALAFWLVMVAYRLPLSIWAGAIALLVVHLGTALPNAPGNVGTYQFFCVVALTLFGVDKAVAAGFSLVVFVLLTAPLWALGALALSRSGLTLGRVRREAAVWLAG
jgi:phosphatidylglycerol lysyltransferase